MQKNAYFNDYFGSGWPDLSYLEPFFMRQGTKWFDDGGNDSAGLSVWGVDGTEQLPGGRGRIDIELQLSGHPDYGVIVDYSKGQGPTYFSKGDLRRIREHTYSLHGLALPIGLFIPFDRAWEAVKEFMQTEGQLPTCIEWIPRDDLPDDIFLEP